MDKLSILILGVAGGASHVYEGHCSSSFIILKNDEPFCLVDLGLGVTHTLKKYGYQLPEKIIITHNHTDHAGELPVVLRVEEAKGRMLQIYSAHPVAERLKKYRLAEHAELYTPQQLAEWISPPPEQKVQLSDELYISFFPTQHSECCYGFIIYQTGDTGDSPLLGYTGDSGVLPKLYDKISKCPVSIFDARENGNEWHASIEAVIPFIQSKGGIIGHDIQTSHAPHNSALLVPGQVINIER